MTCLCERIIRIDETDKYEGNRIVKLLLDTNRGIDLNSIWKLHNSGLFSKEELRNFYKLIGYSLDGYWELFGED